MHKSLGLTVDVHMSHQRKRSIHLNCSKCLNTCSGHICTRSVNCTYVIPLRHPLAILPSRRRSPRFDSNRGHTRNRGDLEPVQVWPPGVWESVDKGAMCKCAVTQEVGLLRLGFSFSSLFFSMTLIIAKRFHIATTFFWAT
ncbi:hypothetical protein EV363DRAFT_1223518, partial [Boletus edulis]